MKNKDTYWSLLTPSGTYKEWDELDSGQKNYLISAFWDFQNLGKFSSYVFYNFKYLVDSKGFSICRKQKRETDYPKLFVTKLTKV